MCSITHIYIHRHYTYMLYVLFYFLFYYIYIGAYFTQFYAHAEQALSNFPGKILL